MHKTCFKCGLEKPLEDFYRHPGMKDGRLNKCKECNKTDVRLNYRANRSHYVEYDYQRFQDPARKRMVAGHQKAMRDRNPYKYTAYRKLNWAIRSGKMVREPCEVCGTTLRVQGHHDDYSKPLDVRWLCFRHHRELHGQTVT